MASREYGVTINDLFRKYFHGEKVNLELEILEYFQPDYLNAGHVKHKLQARLSAYNHVDKKFAVLFDQEVECNGTNGEFIEASWAVNFFEENIKQARKIAAVFNAA